MKGAEAKEILSKRLRELTEENRDYNYKMSDKKQAESIGIPYPTFRNYLEGKSDCSASNLILISKFYDVSTDYLLGTTDVKTTDLTTKQICDYTGLSEEAINKILSIKDEAICSRFERMYDKDKKGRLIYILSKIIEHPDFYRFIVGVNNHIDGTIFFDKHSPTKSKELNDKIKEIRENGYEVIDHYSAEKIRIESILHDLRKIVYQILRQEQELLCSDIAEQE